MGIMLNGNNAERQMTKVIPNKKYTEKNKRLSFGDVARTLKGVVSEAKLSGPKG